MRRFSLKDLRIIIMFNHFTLLYSIICITNKLDMLLHCSAYLFQIISKTCIKISVEFYSFDILMTCINCINVSTYLSKSFDPDGCSTFKI